MTPLFPGNYEGSIKCIVIIRLADRYNREFWAHKADWSKEALQLFRVEAPSYFLQEFNYLYSIQVRNTPFGENIGRVTKGKCGTFPVNALMMIVEAGGKRIPPAQHVHFLIGQIKHILGSKKYQYVYREVVSSHAPGRMAESLAKDDNLFWKILRTCNIDVKRDIPLDVALLDEDIISVMNTIFPTKKIGDWTDDMTKTAYHSGIIPANLLTPEGKSCCD